MAEEATQEWNTGDKSAMVSIGSHKLFLSVSGPDRKSGEPIVVLMQGMGSTIDEWVAVRPLVTPFARWLNYDRSGMGRSESPPEARESISAVSVATDLDTLLKKAGIEPPYIIVCHSWGGLTSREFLHLRPKDVVGMVFVDANTENSFDGGSWPPPFIQAVVGKVDWIEASGLAEMQILSNEEWEAVMKEQQDPRHQATEAAESRGYKGDPPVLAAKKQFERQPLGDSPISVIEGNSLRDWQRIYDAGVAVGNGTEEERSLYRDYIANWGGKTHAWLEENLKLSSFGRMRSTTKSGHNVQLVEPELIAEEIRWVWDHIFQ